MHLQPRPKSASGGTPSSAGFRGLYSPYGFLPEKIQTDSNKQQTFVQLLGDPKKSNISSQQPLRSVSTPTSAPSSRALISYSSNVGNSAAASMMKIEGLEAELDSTREKLTYERIMVGDLEGQVDSLTLQLLELKEQLKIKSWSMVEKDKSLKEADKLNESMAQQGQALLEEMKHDNLMLHSEIKDLREVIVSWEGRWDQAVLSMDESEEQLRHAEKRNQNLEMKISETRLEAKKAQNLAEEKDLEISALRKRNTDLENQVVSISKKLRTGISIDKSVLVVFQYRLLILIP